MNLCRSRLCYQYDLISTPTPWCCCLACYVVFNSYMSQIFYREVDTMQVIWIIYVFDCFWPQPWLTDGIVSESFGLSVALGISLWFCNVQILCEVFTFICFVHMYRLLKYMFWKFTWWKIQSMDLVCGFLRWLGKIFT